MNKNAENKELLSSLLSKEFLTARDVSQLLGINEKKVYTLAHNGRIPGTKVTGKWLFPRRELEELLREEARKTIKRFASGYAVNKKIVLVSGSDDPILYMVQGLFHHMYPDFVIFLSSVGSGEGLRLLKRGLCRIALSHLYDHSSRDYNFPFIRDLFDNPDELVVINLFYRNIGFVSKASGVASFKEIFTKKLRFINRQEGSGIRYRVDHMIAEEELKKQLIRGYGDEVYTHLDVVDHILNDNADVGIAAESVAHYAHLHFYKLFEERFDMVIYKETYFEQSIQVFVEFIRSDAFLKHLKSMKGYDNRATGRVVYSA